MMDWDEMADAQWDYDSLREYETEHELELRLRTTKPKFLTTVGADGQVIFDIEAA